MNRNNFSDNKVELSTRNHSVYYAPAASTSGDKVKIFRFAFECINSEYAHQILNTNDTVEKAVMKYKFSEFILEQLPNYSDDRSYLYREAQLLTINSFYAIDRERYIAISNIKEAKKALNEFDHQWRIPTTKSKHQRTRILRALKNSRKRLDEIKSICSDDLFDKIQRLAMDFEYYW